jgi:hypothetical protein
MEENPGDPDEHDMKHHRDDVDHDGESEQFI